MPCIHGLEEFNCPTCRIVNSTTPRISLKIKSIQNDLLKPEHPLFQQESKKKGELIKEILHIQPPLIHNPINNIIKPKNINELPNFKNKLFLERLNELDVSKLDTFGITKKIPLDVPELKLKKKE